MKRAILGGARLTLPRDLQVAYTVGRMGAVTVADVGPLFFGAACSARWGFGRLTKLGLLRSFPRRDPSQPKWYSLTETGLAWVSEQAEVEESELRRYAGLARMNLAALRARNRFWASVILACRRQGRVTLELFRPERELRRAKGTDVPIVPDALLVLGDRRADAHGSAEAARCSHAFMVELDSGSERRAVWQEKAAAYGALRGAGPLYGAAAWTVLALVPSARRARTIAEAVVKEGAGSFTVIGLAAPLEGGAALDRLLWRATELAGTLDAPPAHSLLDALALDSEAPERLQGPTLAEVRGAPPGAACE